MTADRLYGMFLFPQRLEPIESRASDALAYVNQTLEPYRLRESEGQGSRTYLSPIMVKHLAEEWGLDHRDLAGIADRMGGSVGVDEHGIYRRSSRTGNGRFRYWRISGRGGISLPPTPESLVRRAINVEEAPLFNEQGFARVIIDAEGVWMEYGEIGEFGLVDDALGRWRLIYYDTLAIHPHHWFLPIILIP